MGGHPRSAARRLVTSLGVLGAAVLAVLGTSVPGSAAATLGAQAAVSGRYFGAAVAASRLADPVYARLLNTEFNAVTPQTEMTWDTIEPSRGSFDFGPGDQIVHQALTHGQRLRGHTLVWHGRLPGWVDGISDPDTLRTVMDGHITNVMGHYRGTAYAWDVVDEAFADDGSGRRGSVFQNVLGDGYVEEAFRTARGADPAAELCYDDYGIEDFGAAKTQGVYAMVRDFKARGVPIDCVGFESHFDSGGPPADFATTLANFAALGVDVQITELDIAQAPPAGYADAVGACMAVARCAGITTWGIRDGDSPRSGDTPLLFDSGGNKKPAYFAVLTALGG